MSIYSHFVTDLGLPETITKCIIGEIKIPIATFSMPLPWYGFPPALIPIWSEDSPPSYWGFWKHWFSDRQGSFVDMYLETGRKVTEIGRTVAQFFTYAALSVIMVNDGIEEKLEAFAKQVGVSDLERIDALSLETGDDPKGFTALPQFATNTPLICFDDVSLYDGDFPSGSFASPSWINNCCSFELPDDVIAQWPKDLEMPDWLKPEEQKPFVFEGHMSSGDLSSAWLTLNSTGWKVSEARGALQELKRIAGNDLFSKVVNAWLEVSVGSEDMYY